MRTPHESFANELNYWQTAQSEGSPPSLKEAESYTRQLARSHYENFPVVSWLLPARLRQPFFNVYAFCRWADDLGDELPSTEQALQELDRWREGLYRCFRGEATHPIYIALRETVQKFSLSEEPFHDLISAFERDQRQQRYPTYQDLLDYCRQSANPVGRILLRLSAADCPDNIRLSDNVCTGLQLINFWQDVRRDYQIGRIYLPQADLAQFAVEEADIASDVSTPAFQTLLEFEVDRAEQLLLSGQELSQRVPREIRFDIRLFALGGLALCRKIRNVDFRVLEQRPTLKRSDLPRLLRKAIWGHF